MIKKNYFLFKINLYKRSIIKFSRFLEKSQFWSNDRIMEYKFDLFRKILNHAYKNSEFYKSKYDQSGLDIDSIKYPGDIKKIPILRKKEIKDNLNSILCQNANFDNLSIGATGGSTGAPTPFYYDHAIPVEAFRWRYMKWWGVNPWDDGVFLWRIKKKQTLINKLLWWPTKKIRLDATNLNSRTSLTLINKINYIKPKLIQGYIGAVYELALFILKSKLKIHSPKVVWVTSAPVATYQRKIIEEVFNSPMINEYGSSEIPWIGAQCNANSPLIINDEGRYLEIINKDNKGLGDIIITDLLNYSTPYIRYDIGDKSKILIGKNGINNLSTIDEVKGRSGDKIDIPNVGVIDSTYLAMIFNNYYNAILGFQIIMKKDNTLLIKVVPNKNYSASKVEIEKVRKTLYEKLDCKVKIKIDYVDILKSDGGKNRFIIKE